jgi:hypothetical protein
MFQNKTLIEPTTPQTLFALLFSFGVKSNKTNAYGNSRKEATGKHKNKTLLKKKNEQKQKNKSTSWYLGIARQGIFRDSRK